MSEVVGGAGASEIAGGEGGGGGDGGGGGAPPEWLGGLPDDLKGDATLGRYADVEALARGHLETKRLATSKLAVPAADAPPEAWDAFYTAAGRPESADGYGDFGLDALPDDATDAAKAARGEMVKRYQAALHPLGLNARQAAALVTADIARIEAAQSDYYAAGEAEVNALKKELGADYEPQRLAAKKVFTDLFGEEAGELADELDQKVGSARLVKGMMKLAAKVGESGRIEGDGGEFKGDPANADAALRAKFADKGWREKYNAGDQATLAEHDKLRDAARRQAIATAATGAF
jgi:hypothetical protein